MTFSPSLERIVDAITSCEVSASAKEQAGVLVQGWMEHFKDDVEKLKIKAVEQPWYLWLDERTLACGVRDLVMDTVIGEWKTRKEPRKTKAGVYYKYEGPEDWLSQISNGIQLAAYSMNTGGGRFLVRAAVKSYPPEFWEAEVVIPAHRAEEAKQSFLLTADKIRASRKYSSWRFPDGHTIYGRLCVCSEPFDATARELSVGVGDTDPGQHAIDWALDEHPERDTPDLVILTASGHELFTQCPEAYRRSLYAGGGEENENLAIGKAFHKGLACYYEQIMEAQNGEPKECEEVGQST